MCLGPCCQDTSKSDFAGESDDPSGSSRFQLPLELDDVDRNTCTRSLHPLLIHHEQEEVSNSAAGSAWVLSLEYEISRLQYDYMLTYELPLSIKTQLELYK